VALAGGKYGMALQVALIQKHLDIGTLLLEEGADPNAQGAIFVIPGMHVDMVAADDKYGTVLQAALRRRDLEVITLLLEWKGVDLNIRGANFIIKDVH
jgi:ankyrin repeat protein